MEADDSAVAGDDFPAGLLSSRFFVERVVEEGDASCGYRPVQFFFEPAERPRGVVVVAFAVRLGVLQGYVSVDASEDASLFWWVYNQISCPQALFVSFGLFGFGAPSARCF
ncbi:hypothetical protein AUJ14_03085 [Candidatus Micrarchaeota archaeon CG1_02_55_22]|nr:MAG: hypothetical protein AUJ14_03085 [Candidatus Micrarchaeota archaeon CG1_02_55_22]